MASIVYFKKLDEDDDTARYKFGQDKDNIVRELIVYKANRMSYPLDDRADSEFLNASTRINRLFKEEGTWPRIGVFAGG